MVYQTKAGAVQGWVAGWVAGWEWVAGTRKWKWFWDHSRKFPIWSTRRWFGSSLDSCFGWWFVGDRCSMVLWFSIQMNLAQWRRNSHLSVHVWDMLISTEGNTILTHCHLCIFHFHNKTGNLFQWLFLELKQRSNHQSLRPCICRVSIRGVRRCLFGFQTWFHYVSLLRFPNLLFWHILAPKVFC